MRIYSIKKKIIKDSRKLRKNKDNKTNKKINGIENDKNNVIKTEIDDYGNKKLTKELVQNEYINDTEKKSKSGKSIKLSALKELEQVIEEFELEKNHPPKALKIKPLIATIFLKI